MIPVQRSLASRPSRPADDRPWEAFPLPWVIRSIVLGLVATALVSLAVQGLAGLRGVGFEDFSKDPAQHLDGEFFTGWYHYLVVLVWQVPATTALVGSYVLHRIGRAAPARMLLVAGVLTAAMVLDDLFLLHDAVYRNLGVPQVAVYAGYGLATVAFAWAYRARLGAGVLLLAGTLVCWALSAGIDVLLREDAPYVVEDGAKAAGVVLWTLLVVPLAVGELRRALVDRMPRPAPSPVGRHRRGATC